MKKNIGLIIIGMTIMLLTQAVYAQEYPKMNLRFANTLPEQQPPSKADIFVAEELAKRTNGAVKVKLFHGGVLGGHKEVLDLIGEGAVDMGNFVAAYNFSRIPMEAFFSMPCVYPDVQTLVELNRKGWEFSKKMQADHVENNVYPFNFRGLGIMRLVSKKPIRTMADLKGLKVRSFGAIYPKVLSKLGAVPVNMQYHEVYEGLQRGTVDAAVGSYGLAFAYKLFEVGKYMIDINLGTDPVFRSYINLELYNSWPQNLKDMFNQIVLEAEATSVQTMVGFDQYALKTMQDAGVNVVKFEDQDQVDALRDFVIDLTAETISAQGQAYAEPTKEYASWLKTELDKRK